MVCMLSVILLEHSWYTHMRTHTQFVYSYWRDKLDVMVEFPMSGLDLTSYVQNPDDPEPVYDLFAVSNHFGGMGGGHCE